MDVKEYGTRASSPPFESGQDGRAPEDVPPGYKRTEVGVIPEDWEWERLGVECDLVTKGTTPTSIERQFVTDGIRFLKAESISDEGKIIPEMIDFIDESTHRLLRRSQLQVDDLLVSIAGVLGKIGQVREGDSPANTNQALAIVRLKKRAHINRNFLFWYLRGENIQKQILDISVQGAQANISLQNVRDFQIVQPEEGEQLTIAEALSDADALIESLQQLIAKQRVIKQGAMQALLTGRQRLPGFTGTRASSPALESSQDGRVPNGEWQTKRLSELTDIRSGGTPSTGRADYWDGDVLWCTPTDITALDGRKYLNGTARKITQLGLKSSSAELIPAHSIVMTSRATIGACAINTAPVTTNQGFKNFVPFNDVNVEFLYYLLCTQTNGLISLCGGSTFLEISKAQLSVYEVKFPPTIEEQTAIANVLSDMDAGIDALEARLAKTRALKTGMMQALLTGRIRLV